LRQRHYNSFKGKMTQNFICVTVVAPASLRHLKNCLRCYVKRRWNGRCVVDATGDASAQLWYVCMYVQAILHLHVLGMHVFQFTRTFWRGYTPPFTRESP